MYKERNQSFFDRRWVFRFMIFRRKPENNLQASLPATDPILIICPDPCFLNSTLNTVSSKSNDWIKWDKKKLPLTKSWVNSINPSTSIQSINFVSSTPVVAKVRRRRGVNLLVLNITSISSLLISPTFSVPLTKPVSYQKKSNQYSFLREITLQSSMLNNNSIHSSKDDNW